MKIVKYEKKKNGIYQIFLDDGNNVDLHEEVILKHELLIRKETNTNLLNIMLDENRTYIAYDLSIKYIAKKMRTEKEIREYLKTNNFDNKVVDDVISLLLKNSYIDDYKYSSMYVNDRLLLSYDGPLKIREKLVSLGVCDDAINEALKKFNTNSQIDKVSKIVEKEAKINRNKSNVLLKNKILNKLMMLGYDRSISLSVVNNFNFKNDKDAYDVQYKKIYDRLSKKYSGKELEFKVNQKMYALGFKNNYE